MLEVREISAVMLLVFLGFENIYFLRVPIGTV